jgi:hypothetical protein
MSFVQDKQSLLDIAVESAGSAEAVFGVALANNKSITGRLSTGEELKDIPEANRNIAAYYREKGLKPATGGNQEGTSMEGIGYMAVESNFKIA